MRRQQSQGQYAGVLLLGQGSFLNPTFFSLSPREPELPPSSSEPTEKGLGRPFPKEEPANTTPPPLPRDILGISYLCSPRGWGPKSIPKHTTGAAGPPSTGGADGCGSCKGRWDGEGFAFSQQCLFAYQKEKGKRIVRLQWRPTELLQREGPQRVRF